jgi:hypothetical protein
MNHRIGYHDNQHWLESLRFTRGPTSAKVSRAADDVDETGSERETAHG